MFDSLDISEVTETEKKKEELKEGEKTQDKAASPDVFTTLKFNFTIYSVKTVIYQGDNQLVGAIPDLQQFYCHIIMLET